MAALLAPDREDDLEPGDIAPGRLPENILYFARALRTAGLPVGPGAVLDAVAAATAGPLTTREDFRSVLQAVFVKRRDQAPVFDGVFRVFWRRRGFLEQLMGAMSPKAPPKSAERPKAEAGATRVADALFKRAPAVSEAHPSLDLDARFSVSAEEVLRRKDFAQMSADEMAAATAAIRAMRMPDDVLRLRRLTPDARGTLIDPRRSFRRSLRAGGAGIDLARLSRSERPPPIVAICDISGSVADYTRVFLHFLHALSARRRVSAFLCSGRGSPTCPAPSVTAMSTKRWRRSRRRFRTGRAAPASPLRCISSTSTGCVASGPDAPPCCSSPTGSSAMPKAISKPRCVDCAAPAVA